MSTSIRSGASACPRRTAMSAKSLGSLRSSALNRACPARSSSSRHWTGCASRSRPRSEPALPRRTTGASQMNTTAQRRRTRNERTPTKLARRPDAGGALALYQQAKEFITARIQDGSWPPGHRLPSENELVAQFGVSRMTVNRAFRELMDQGRVVRVAGVGSFVAEARPQSTLLRIANLGEEIRRRGHEYECRLLLLQRTSASLEIATSLDLATGESVYHSVCVHLENGVPVQLEDRYVSPRMAPDF